MQKTTETTTEKTSQKTEAEFVREKREKQIAAAFPNGFRRFRYLVPASSLSRIPIRGSGE